jgi:hypothetical protein
VNIYISRLLRVVRNTIFRKAPPSVVSGYGKRLINLNKVVATFEKHIFLSQTDLTRTAKFKLVFCAKYDRGLDLGFWEILAAIM